MHEVAAAPTRVILHTRSSPAGKWGVAGPVGVAGLLTAGVVYIATHNPHEGAIAPTCMLLATTGHWCPSCGGTRAVYDLLHGDLAGALHMNAFVVLVLLPAAVVGLAWWAAHALGLRVPHMQPRAWHLAAFLAATLSFWAVRNVEPFESFLAP